MAENFYRDNPDLRFHLMHVDLRDIVRLRERDYAEAAEFPEAPESYEDSLDSYDRVLAMVGELCGDHIAPRARDVDLHGATFREGVVCYAPGTQQNLEDMRKAELGGVTLPRQFGGLNFPTTLYTMMMEMVSRWTIFRAASSSGLKTSLAPTASSTRRWSRAVTTATSPTGQSIQPCCRPGSRSSACSATRVIGLMNGQGSR